MTKPIVSVICSVRNGAEYLGSVLDSVVAQTLREWELILIDDGSSDGSVELARARAAAEPRMRLVTTPGIGRGHALNLALRTATADLIANVDADDPMHPERLRLQRAAMDDNPGFDVIGTHSLIIEGYEVPRWPVVDMYPTKVHDVTSRLAFHNAIMHSSVLMRADALRRVAGYDASRRSQFDYDLWVRLAGSGSRLGVLPLALAAKRKHSGQSFENKQRLRYLWRSAGVQSRAIRATGAPASTHLTVVARFAYGVLPEALRNGVRKLRAARNP